MTGERGEFRERYANDTNEYPDSSRKLESNMIVEKLLTEYSKEKPDWDDTKPANDYFTFHLLKELSRRDPEILGEIRATIGPHADFDRAPLLEIHNNSGSPAEYQDLDEKFRSAMTAYRDAMNGAEEQPREHVATEFAQLLTYPVIMGAEETGVQDCIDRTQNAQERLATGLNHQEPSEIVQAVQELNTIRGEIRESRR